MKIATGAVFVAFMLALPAAAQPVPPAYDDEPDFRGRSAEFQEAYRRAYERGFERGYAKGLADGERRGAVVAPAPAPRTGPIRITGAVYGTSSKNCDGTRWLAHRANGKHSYSVEITNDICGDPARGDRKSLDVTYYCGEIQKTASANEHRTIYLSCAS